MLEDNTVKSNAAKPQPNFDYTDGKKYGQSDKMKYIHYKAEGDILSLTFEEIEGQVQTGIELSDNIVFYYNPETREALGLVLLGYHALLRASEQSPLPLEGLSRAPAKVQEIVTPLLQRAPVTSFFQLEQSPGKEFPTSRLSQVFTPVVLQAVA